MTNLTAHTIVRNEEQWIWYAIQSVLEYVEQIIIFDTGSTDDTIKIIKSIHSPKIKLLEKGTVTPERLVALRNEQLQMTKTDWFLLLDGDEVWPEPTIKELVRVIPETQNHLSAIAVKAMVPVGDLFHYQSESAGRYEILGRRGHFNIRGYRIKEGYKWEGIYPLEAYADTNHIPVQKKNDELVLLKNAYWHLTHLVRSSRRRDQKYKYEIGKKINDKLPEVFFKTRQAIVPSPWISFSGYERIKAIFLTPLREIKRKLEL